VVFTLEALRAKHGDSLIVHFGDADAPRFLVIDGGPSGVYKDAFRPRLDALASRFAQGSKLPLDIVMVSHLDDDHIRGILDLSGKLLETRRTQQPPFKVGTLWHNAFDDIVGNDAPELATAIAEAPARIAAAAGEASAWVGESTAVVANVPQGRRLRDDAQGLGWEVNKQFGAGLVMAPAEGARTEHIGSLKITVVGPMQDEVERLQDEWDAQLKKLKIATRADEAARIAAYLDRSVYNLSSLVCLAEFGGKRMLLTGDARGDRICAGLRRANLLPDDEPLAVDILKLPHHGSDRNVDSDFFERIRADHYVASGDGKYDNPSPATIAMIVDARSDDDFTIHLTYPSFKGKIDKELKELFAAHQEAGRRYGLRYRGENDLSLRVDLLERVTA
jgi:hypothetical protein